MLNLILRYTASGLDRLARWLAWRLLTGATTTTMNSFGDSFWRHDPLPVPLSSHRQRRDAKREGESCQRGRWKLGKVCVPVSAPCGTLSRAHLYLASCTLCPYKSLVSLSCREYLCGTVLLSFLSPTIIRNSCFRQLCCVELCCVSLGDDGRGKPVHYNIIRRALYFDHFKCAVTM